MNAYYKDEWVTIYHGDCREILPSLPKVDLVLTDPPYESMRRWEGIGTTARMGMGKKGSSADDSSKFFKTISNSDLLALLPVLSELLRESRHCYIMCDEITLPYFYSVMRRGFECYDEYENACIYDQPPPFDNMKPLIWDKVSMGMGYHYRCQYEFVIMFDKGKNRRLNSLSIPDILRFKRVEGNTQEVPTQKPLELFNCLVNQSSLEGEIILDPFLGSGTTAVCAKKLNRHCIGIEIEEKYCEIAANRCRQDVMRLEL